MFVKYYFRKRQNEPTMYIRAKNQVSGNEILIITDNRSNGNQRVQRRKKKEENALVLKGRLSFEKYSIC